MGTPTTMRNRIDHDPCYIHHANSTIPMLRSPLYIISYRCRGYPNVREIVQYYDKRLLSLYIIPVHVHHIREIG